VNTVGGEGEEESEEVVEGYGDVGRGETGDVGEGTRVGCWGGEGLGEGMGEIVRMGRWRVASEGG
jgi:hypothetical protein